MIEQLKHSRWPIGIGLVLLAVDFFTKWIANVKLPLQEPVQSGVSYLHWYLTYNRGYHYIFGEMTNFRLIQSLGLIAVLVLIGLMVRKRFELPESDPNRRLFTGYIVLLIGATGNPWETLILGRVTDFFVFTPLPWPSNLADQYINIAIYILLPIWIIISIREWLQEKKAGGSNPGTQPSESQESP